MIDCMRCGRNLQEKVKNVPNRDIQLEVDFEKISLCKYCKDSLYRWYKAGMPRLERRVENAKLGSGSGCEEDNGGQGVSEGV